jgi:hypothetical protein
MKKSCVTVRPQGAYQTTVALRNDGGYFVHILPDARHHRKQKLILRLPTGKKGSPTEIALNGRQIASLRRVLAKSAEV